MKISLNWVSDFIDIEDYRSRIDELSKLLTSAGLEVEGLVDQKAQFQNVVVGKLLSVEKHPDADKLTLCQLDTGEGTPRQIVCGAKNHKAGDLVIAALPGAVLPGDFAIKKSKIRGVESLGMLCSDKELGLSSEGEGIRILPEGKPGQLVSDLLGLNDVIFELNVTPNRADCLSHRGLAQELSALLNRPLKKENTKLKVGAFKTTDSSKITLQDSDKCPRYAGRMIRGVKVGESPLWLKQRLESVGLRSINNVVDVTNYIMFDYGQPMHAFDWAQIGGGEIIIRPSKKGEAFKTLDGTDLELTGDELVIADQNRAVALAGVTGGLNSGVSETSKDIFLEAAFFTAQGVRRTSRRFGIDTDSSYRFTRGVNPEQTIMALEKACDLMVQVAGGEVGSDWHDVYPKPLIKAPIRVAVAYVSERVGYEVDAADFDAVMKRLGFKVEGDQYTPPAHRWDLSIPEDLVEEYARVNGYDKLGENLPVLIEEPTPHADAYLQTRRVGEFLVQQGFDQAVNYAFVNKNLQAEVLGQAAAKAGLGLNGASEIAVRNPVSEDFAVMRMSLLPSLVQNVTHNLRHGNREGRIFELGHGHYAHDAELKEEARLGFAIWGSPVDLWGRDVPAVYRLKSAIENLLQTFASGSKWQWKSGQPGFDSIHPSQCAELVFQGQTIGFLGSVHPQLSKANKWREDVAFAEVNFRALFKNTKVQRFKPLSAFPGIDKDATFVLPKTLAAAEVQKEIAKSGGLLLQSVDVVDLYEGTGIPEDQRALSFRLSFQSAERTLSDEEILKLFQDIIQSVTKKLSITLR